MARYIFLKLTQRPCMCYSKIPSIDQRTNERATRSAGRDSDWFVRARVGDRSSQEALGEGALSKQLFPPIPKGVAEPGGRFSLRRCLAASGR